MTSLCTRLNGKIVFRLRVNTAMFVVVSVGLTLCVPLLGLLALSLAVKLYRTIPHHQRHDHHDNRRHDDQQRAVDYRQLSSHESVVFWVVFFTCACLRKTR